MRERAALKQGMGNQGMGKWELGGQEMAWQAIGMQEMKEQQMGGGEDPLRCNFVCTLRRA